MNLGGGAGAVAGGPSASAAPDLQDVQTEQLAFQSVSPNSTLLLLPSAWPEDNPPPTTASLLAVAPTKAIVAAAAPDTLVVAKTHSVRKALIEGSAGDNNIKNFQPEATISVPRVNQVCFSSDESCLVIAAEQGGGLAVYNTNAILNGGKDPAFQLATEGQAVRHLLPNPNSAPDLARYFAIVTDQGNLLLADLQEQKLVRTAAGNAVFHDGIYCACWSRLGRQIIAGRNDGTAVQIDPQGNVKATIPEPPQLATWKNPNSNGHPLSSIYWLDTNDFLVIHTPVNPPGAMAEDDSIYHLARREKPSSQAWTFAKLTDPCPAFGAERKPSHHFIQRLRDWGPDLSDMLILAATASSDAGAFTLSRAPLNPEQPVVDAWTATIPPDDGRLSMPMSGDMGADTSPIGMALDLSVTEKAPKPIPTDESIEFSPVELPALYILNNEGRLSAWYVVYRPSIRQSVIYPDMIAAGGPRPLTEQKQQTPAQTPKAPTTTNAFGSNTTPALTSPFGNGSSATTFGGASALGSRPSPWASPGQTATGGAGFGRPSFGTPSTPGGGTAFGSTSALGTNRASPWGQQSPQRVNSSESGSGVFGGNLGQQSGFASFANTGKSTASPFATFGSNSGDKPAASPFATFGSGSDKPAASPFAAFGSNTEKSTASPFAALGSGGDKLAASPFAAVGGSNKDGQSSAFGTQPKLPAEPSGSTVSLANTSSFGTGSTTFGGWSESFGKPSATSREETMGDSDEKPKDTPPSGLFGAGVGGFKLGSTFKGDGTAKNDIKQPTSTGSELFGTGFGSALGEVAGKKGPSEAPPVGAPFQSPAIQTGTTTQQATSEKPEQPVTPIKTEPGLEDEPRLADIPPATTTPPSPPKQEKKPVVDDAPLPPDPATWKPKPEPPLASGFRNVLEKSLASAGQQNQTSMQGPEDAPLPPDFTAASRKEPEPTSDKPLAGSPPVDLGEAQFSEVPATEEEGPATEEEGPAESDEEWSDEDDTGDEEEVDDDDEDGEEDAEEDGESEEKSPVISNNEALNAFKARLTPASPKRESHKAGSTTPKTEKKGSYTPAGLPNPSVVLPPPNRVVNASPRSPSPVRSATSPVRLGMLAQQRQPSSQQASQLAAASLKKSIPQRTTVPPRRPGQGERHAQQANSIEQEIGDLEDEDAARVQAVLKAPIKPTRVLPAFLAHQDYVGDSGAPSTSTNKTGLGGQIERVYRDINSMIDTLALNARSMRAFVEGHRQLRDYPIGRDTLEDEENWTFDEIEDLMNIADAVDEELEDGRLDNVGEKLATLRIEEQEMTRTKLRGADLRKQLLSFTDPAQKAQQAAAELPMEAQAQQVELRQNAQKMQALLAKAEEQLSLLRAELASHAQSTNSSAAAVPTVEAVTNTILKMTAMIERKSGDVDVLEAQIRRLGGTSALHSSLSRTYEDDLAASMRASRISHGSPALARSTTAAIGRWNGNGSVYQSPSASRASPGLRNSQVGTDGLRKSLFDVSETEVKAYSRRRVQRKNVLAALRGQVEAKGTHVVVVGNRK